MIWIYVHVLVAAKRFSGLTIMSKYVFFLMLSMLVNTSRNIPVGHLVFGSAHFFLFACLELGKHFISKYERIRDLRTKYPLGMSAPGMEPADRC